MAEATLHQEIADEEDEDDFVPVQPEDYTPEYIENFQELQDDIIFKLEVELSNMQTIISLVWSEDGRYLACALQDGQIKIFNTEAVELYTLQTNVAIRKILWRPFARCKPSQKYTLLVAASDGCVHFWHVTSQKLISTSDKLKTPSSINTLSYGVKKDVFAVGHEDYSVCVYDGPTRKVVHHFEDDGVLMGHRNRVSACKFDPSHGNILVSSSWDQQLVIWDIRQKLPVASLLIGQTYYETLEVTSDEIVIGCNATMKKLPAVVSYDKRFLTPKLAVNYREFPTSMYNIQQLSKERFLLGGSDGLRMCKIEDCELAMSPELSGLADVFVAHFANGRVALQGTDKGESNSTLFRIYNLSSTKVP